MNADLVGIGKRIRQARKYLNLTQAEFGEKIGIAGPSVLNIELSRNKQVPENIIKLICSTFGIDYFWLTTGEGEMFVASDNPVADMIDNLLEGENETAKSVFRAFSRFSEEDWKLVQKFIDSLKNEK